jgi:fumarylacetoacetate (FAA) hydrolase family protein
VLDVSHIAPTTSDLLAADDLVPRLLRALDDGRTRPLGDVAALIANSHADRRDPNRPYLLAPCDLQAVRACGVTFVASMLERVIEEHAKGDAAQADEIRAFWFRDLRAKAADDKADQAGEKEAQNLLGHTDGRMTARHYLRRGKIVGPTR